MKLDREKLIAMSVDYFEGCNEHNLEKSLGVLSDDCLMWFPAAPFRYTGKVALDIHLKDVFKTFKTIYFRDYKHVVDEVSQSIVTYFNVTLTPYEGDIINMKNCNIFHGDEEGKFKEVIIYNSGALSAGFHEGSE
ncbi:nuclear transport factor 2 family protein [Paraglaciecola sp. 2405UD69-4]|uniref:nuclear transport factor 2 family protein n=1 Tax=Paraglaciecola sp. 2405UD69-4 TaxID=3391836 RepID=UPI0039C9069C